MQEPGKHFKVEKLDLEFSNGEKRTYERLLTHGLGAVIVVAMRDNDTVLLVREYAAGLHHYELGLVTALLKLLSPGGELRGYMGADAGPLQEQRPQAFPLRESAFPF